MRQLVRHGGAWGPFLGATIAARGSPTLLIDFNQGRKTNSARLGLSGGWRATLALDKPGPYTPTEAKWRVTCMQFMRREADGSRREYPRP